MTYLLPPVDTRDQWAAIFTDVSVWRAVVSEICSREKLRCRSIEAGYPGSNAVFVVDREIVVKIYHPFWEEFEAERDLHIALGQNREIPIPLYVSSGVFTDRIEWPYLITEFVEGTPIREVREALGREQLLNVSARLGVMVRALHDMDLCGVESSGQQKRSRSTLDQRAQKIVALVREKGRLTGVALKQLESFLRASISQAEGEDRVLVHGDLTEDHLLLAERGGSWEITGLLDFGDAQHGPIEYEWPALWVGLLARDAGALKAFFASYDPNLVIDETFIAKAFRWTLLHEFGYGMIEDALSSHSASSVRSVDDLRELLWPNRLLES